MRSGNWGKVLLCEGLMGLSFYVCEEQKGLVGRMEKSGNGETAVSF